MFRYFLMLSALLLSASDSAGYEVGDRVIVIRDTMAKEKGQVVGAVVTGYDFTIDAKRSLLRGLTISSRKIEPFACFVNGCPPFASACSTKPARSIRRTE